MNLSIRYGAWYKKFEIPDHEWPHGDSEKSARTAVTLYLRGVIKPDYLWTGPIFELKSEFDSLGFVPGSEGNLRFIVKISNIGGPW